MSNSNLVSNTGHPAGTDTRRCCWNVVLHGEGWTRRLLPILIRAKVEKGAWPFSHTWRKVTNVAGEGPPHTGLGAQQLHAQKAPRQRRDFHNYAARRCALMPL